jgi:predicted AAA+ superfamily ATPase
MAYLFRRNILQYLQKWKTQKERKPLILRGARQVGKTTAVHLFAKTFEHYIYLNMEKTEERNLCEQTATFDELIEAIFFFKKVPKTSKNVLIFFDEIQSSPKVVSMLRFFEEERPDLHVIAAGSLLETLMDKHLTIPVGRVEYLYLYPFTFDEFLFSMDEKELYAFLNGTKIPAFAHQALLKWFRRYTLIGGMPEVVRKFAESQDVLQINPIYEGLLSSYLDDVEKYAQNSSLRQVIRHCIRTVFFEAGKRIKFQGFGHSNYRSREVGEALRTLEKAMLIRLVYPTTQVKLPLMPNFKKAPKLQVLDTGLINYFASLQEELFRTPEIDTVYEGKIAEHIVGQELIARLKSQIRPFVFWTREKKQSNAEIDFLLPFQSLVIPIEVKAGAVGKLRSLHLFMDSVDHPFAIRVYSGPFRVDEVKTMAGKPFKLINLPFYLIGNWEKILEKMM